MKDFLFKFFGISASVRATKTPAEKLLMSIRATAKCRYAASIRLRSKSEFSFFTTTILSLGLIFIPLMQNSKVKLNFPDPVLNMMQIFLAVAVLVYSITISKAGYEVRAEKLNECGDKLKDLGRKLDDDLSKVQSGALNLEQYRKSYSDIVTDAENHDRLDYIKATLDMPNDYDYSGIHRIYLSGIAFFNEKSTYALPVVLMLIELTFITEMLGISNFYPVSLKSLPVVK